MERDTFRGHGSRRRRGIAVAGFLALLCAAAFDPGLTPQRRLHEVKVSCDCGGLNGTLKTSARQLSLKQGAGSPELFPLPFADVGIDLRGRLQERATLPYNLATWVATGTYRPAWAGDGSSNIVVFQMPRQGLWWDYWDLSDWSSGRIGLTLDEVAATANGDKTPIRGGFLVYPWGAFLSNAADQPGPVVPRPFFGQTATLTCQIWTGQTYPQTPLTTYGDSAPFQYKIDLDVLGYMRQYDMGSCSASGSLRGLFERLISSAPAEGKTYTGAADVTISTSTYMLAPELYDVPSLPTAAGNPLRAVGDDSIALDFFVSGSGNKSGVTCPFSATWSGRIRPSINEDRRHHERFAFATTDISPFTVGIGSCNASWIQDFLLTLGSAIGALDWPPSPSTTVKPRDGVDEAGYRVASFLAPPAPRPDMFANDDDTSKDKKEGLGVKNRVRRYVDELSSGTPVDAALLANATGPAGSCLADDLGRMDDGKCTYGAILTPLVVGTLGTPAAEIGQALGTLMMQDPNLLECRPVGGSFTFAKRTNDWPVQDQPFTYLARQLGDCPSNDAPRIFILHDEAVGDRLVMACVQKDCTKSFKCWQNQDGGGPGENCNYDALKEKGCISPPVYWPEWKTSPPVPQVVCRDMPGVSGSKPRCEPRFFPATQTSEYGEKGGICVPMAIRNPYDKLGCDDCRALTSPVLWTSIPAYKDRAQKCLAAPAYCRVPAGAADPQSCDATTPKDIRDRKAKLFVPFRCGLRMPVSRASIEPDRLNLILTEGYDWKDPPPLLNAQRDLWNGLGLAIATSQAGAGTAVGAPACFPWRDEGPRKGFMGLVGETRYDAAAQVNRVLTNAPKCGYIKN